MLVWPSRILLTLGLPARALLVLAAIAFVVLLAQAMRSGARMLGRQSGPGK